MVNYIENTKLIFNLFTDKSNWESVTRNVNISHKNLNYLHARLICEHKNSLDFQLTQETILEWVAEDDFNNCKFDLGSKEMQYATTVNTVFNHHRLIYIKKIFDNTVVNNVLGFNALHVFLDLPKEFYDCDNVIKRKDLVEATGTKGIVELFSIEFDMLKKKTVQEIVNLLEEKPIVAIGDYLVLSSSANFINTYIETLTYVLKDDEEFKALRGELFEELVFEICQFYYGDNVYKNVKFHNGESDIVVETDEVLCVIECKAIMPYRIYKWNQNKQHISNNFKDIILKPLQQGLKFFEKLDQGYDFSSDGRKITFDKDKKRMIISVSVDQILGWSNYMECHFPDMFEEIEMVGNNCAFKHLSFSDFLSIHQSVTEQLFDVNNFDDGISGILSTSNLTSDFLESFQFMHTTPLQQRELILKMKEEGADIIIQQQFQCLSEYDKNMEIVMMQCYRKNKNLSTSF